MTALVLASVIGGVVLAATLQRLTGIGYALVASPVLVVAVGADEAVRVVTVTSLVSSGLALRATWHACRPRQVLPLLPFAFAAVWPAGLFAAAVSPGAASLLAGLVVLLALGIALRPAGLDWLPRWAQAGVAGSLAGAMNAVAALGGPMAATYGLGRRWTHSLVPNLQLFLLLSSFTVVWVRGWPAATQTWQLGILAVGAALGVFAGGRLAHGVAPRQASYLTAGIAVVGAVIAILRGIGSLT